MMQNPHSGVQILHAGVLAALALSALSPTGCARAPSSGRSPDAATGCAAEVARPCACTDGRSGVQRCAADGRSYSACECAAAGAADLAGLGDLGEPDASQNDAGLPAGADAGTDDPAAPPLSLAFPPLLGRPTDRGVAVNVVPTEAVEVAVDVFDAADVRVATTAPVALAAGEPHLLEVTGLSPDAAYRYALRGRAPGGAGPWRPGPGGRLHTWRPPGAPFTFTLQADSHLDDRSDVELYHQSLQNARAAEPDFHLDLGDTFMCEKHAEPFTGEKRSAPDHATVEARYRGERAHFGVLSADVPLFLINGNHEGETGRLRDGTGDSLPEWAMTERLRYYANPAPDDFYSGPPAPEPDVGERRAYYAFTWGDALIVVLDPFWYTRGEAQDFWGFSLGNVQYAWLAQTLADSDARYKLVFAHHLVGGLDSNRGGVEAAHLYEWGGLEPSGADAFAARRPGWPMPIHELLVQQGVTAFFHGHDHLYAHQTLDGIAYQEVPQPSAPNDRNLDQLTADGGYSEGTLLPSSGILRIDVSPERLRVTYLRSHIGPTADQNGAVADTYDLEPAPR